MAFIEQQRSYTRSEGCDVEQLIRSSAIIRLIIRHVK